MTVLKTREVERALIQKFGFVKTETHHQVYHLRLDSQLIARTYISHGERELSDYHLAQMAKQTHLRKDEFLDAVNCPLSREEYYRLAWERNQKVD